MKKLLLISLMLCSLSCTQAVEKSDVAKHVDAKFEAANKRANKFKAGQVWVSNVGGNDAEILEVGKYVVYERAFGDAKYLEVASKEVFLRRNSLFTDVIDEKEPIFKMDGSGIPEFKVNNATAYWSCLVLHPDGFTCNYNTEEESEEWVYTYEENPDHEDWTVLNEGELYYVDGEDGLLLIGGGTKKPYIYKNPKNDHTICTVHGDLDVNDESDAFRFTIDTFITIDGTTYCYKCYWDTQKKLINQYITGI